MFRDLLTRVSAALRGSFAAGVYVACDEKKEGLVREQFGAIEDDFREKKS
jgi:hypothetical protein